MQQFRKARPEDLSGIMTVIHQAQAFMATQEIDQWQDGYPSEAQIASDIAKGFSYVFDADGIIASITYLTAEPEPAYAELEGAWHTAEPCLTIHRMALGDAYRHSGMAAEILTHAIAIAHAQQLSGIRVDTHRGNRAMRRFLEKHGFQQCGYVRYEMNAGDPIRVAYDLPL